MSEKMEDGYIALKKEFFSIRESEILKYNELRAVAFIYNTGVKAIKLINDIGYIIILPYNGQQIWDAVFEGRSLRMKSMFDEPKDVDFFLNTYGCFMMHCGAWRMGCPGPEDNHPLHGELPYAAYDTVEIIFGRDEKGEYIGITGAYSYDLAFSVHYTAKPVIKIYEKSSLIDISMEIKNRSGYPMELMYMTHVNFKPVVGGEIIQTLKWDPDHIVIRKTIPSHVKVTDNFLNFLGRLEKRPELSKVIKKEDEYKPEVAFFMNNPDVDNKGWSHFLQIHPDGSSDYIKYRPSQFDHATRWIMRTKDQEALGLALPATCDPEGYTAEKKKGNIKYIEEYGSVKFNLFAGYLNKEETQNIRDRLKNILV